MSTPQAAATVVRVQERPLPYYTLSLQVPATFAQVAPGQFVMVQTDALDPYLRRAFSVFDVSNLPSSEGSQRSTIELLGKVIGPGTRRLADLPAKARLALLGPLGRGFHLVEKGRPALVAGGVGSAGLLLLARSLLEVGVSFDFFYGGRSAVDLACHEVFGAICTQSGGKLIATTEDGSAGTAGLVTGPLAEALEQGRYHHLYTCGPMPLMKRVAELAALHRIGGQAALETAMGCGYGACIGCAVPHLSGRYALCCKDGPVFDFEEVDWPAMPG